MIITDSTFEIIAAKYYNNPNCIEKEEFLEDFNRFRYVKRLIKKYRNGGELKERLILNHLVVFGVKLQIRPIANLERLTPMTLGSCHVRARPDQF